MKNNNKIALQKSYENIHFLDELSVELDIPSEKLRESINAVRIRKIENQIANGHLDPSLGVQMIHEIYDSEDSINIEYTPSLNSQFSAINIGGLRSNLLRMFEKDSLKIGYTSSQANKNAIKLFVKNLIEIELSHKI